MMLFLCLTKLQENPIQTALAAGKAQRKNVLNVGPTQSSETMLTSTSKMDTAMKKINAGIQFRYDYADHATIASPAYRTSVKLFIQERYLKWLTTDRGDEHIARPE